MDPSQVIIYIAPLMIFAFMYILLVGRIDEIKKKLSRFFGFSQKKDDIERQYICPRCGSTNWKFANPIKPSDSMINLPHLVNNLTECRDCSYIGIFFIKDKKETIPLKQQKHRKKAHAIKVSKNFKRITIVISAFLFANLVIGSLIPAVAFALATGFLYDSVLRKKGLIRKGR